MEPLHLSHHFPSTVVSRKMPKQTRKEVEVTSALKNILDNYPAGSETMREILQNTDDAGAKKQVCA